MTHCCSICTSSGRKLSFRNELTYVFDTNSLSGELSDPLHTSLVTMLSLALCLPSTVARGTVNYLRVPVSYKLPEM
jgi:hypothetical protein